MSLLEYLFATERKEKEKGIIVKEKYFGKGEINSYKYEGMISIPFKCTEFIDTDEVIAMLFIQL